MLQEAVLMLAQGQWDEAEPLVTLEPDEDGRYQVTPALADDVRRSPADETEEIGDHRQIVFLDAKALLRAR
jgi:hypothetical protein